MSETKETYGGEGGCEAELPKGTPSARDLTEHKKERCLCELPRGHGGHHRFGLLTWPGFAVSPSPLS